MIVFIVFKKRVVCFPNFACFGWHCIDQDQQCLYIYIYMYIYIILYIYMYTYRYIKYIYLQCMQAVLSVFNVISERASLIKKKCVVPPPSSFLLPFHIHKPNLSLCAPLLQTALLPSIPYSPLHFSSPPPLSPLSTSSFPPLPAPTSLCFHQTAQC